MCVLLSWRTAVGALAVQEAGETSMIIGLPMWWTYALAGAGSGTDRAGGAGAGRPVCCEAGRLLRRRALDGDALTPTAIGLLMFGGMLLLMAARVPIAAAMFIPGALGYWVMTNDMALLNQFKGSAVARLTVYDLSVIPLFLLMGQFATQGGLSRSLFKAAAACVGHIRGGLAMAAILSAAAFGAVCGSSVATAATITQVAYPEMRAHGYHGRLATATLASGGTLGILIPPSVPLVVYAILTEQNIAKLFAAAMVPGLIAMFGYLIVIAITCRLRPELAQPSEPLPMAERWQALLGIWPIVADLHRRLRRHLCRLLLAHRGCGGGRGGHLRRRPGAA